MYAFTPDEKHVVFADAWGLTRITLPNKLKTDRATTASALGTLSLDAAGTTLALWCDADHQAKVLAMPTLSRHVAVPRFRCPFAWCSPDGEWLLSVENHALSLTPMSGKKARLFPLPAAPEGAETFTLGTDRVAYAPYHGLVCARPDGGLAVLSTRNDTTTLWLGHLDANAGVSWQRGFVVTLRATGTVRLWPTADGFALVARSMPTETAHIVEVSGAGSPRAKSLRALVDPARRGAGWVTQVAPDRVVEVDADGQEQTTFVLADPLHHGHGTLLIGPTRSLFVTHDGERVVDLTTGVACDRKLPAAEAPVRAYFHAQVERHNRFGRRFGREMLLGRVRYYSGGTGASPHFTSTGGDGTLGVALTSVLFAQEVASARLSPGGVRVGGFSSSGVAEHLVEPLTPETVGPVLEAIDAGGLRFAMALAFLGRLYARHRSNSSMYVGESPGNVAGVEAARMLLRSVLAHLKPEDGPWTALGPNLKAWAATPVTVAEVQSALEGFDPQASRLSPVLHELVEMLDKAMEPEAFDTLLLWGLLDTPAALVWNSSSALLSHLERIVRADPLRGAGLRAGLLAHAPVHHPQLGDMRAMALTVIDRG